MTVKELTRKCGCFGRKRRKQGQCHQEEQQHGPLSENCRGGKVKICKVNGDRKLCAKMAALGVIPGEEAELICRRNGSQCLLKIHGGTLSLDHTTSSNIIVQAV